MIIIGCQGIGKEKKMEEKTKIDCIYCDGPWENIIEYEDYRKTDEYIFVYLTRDGNLHVDATAGVYEPNFLEAERKIKYCPMCGRKLEEKYEQDKICNN